MKNRQENNAALRSLNRLSGQGLPGRLSHKCRCGSRPCTCETLPDGLAQGDGNAMGNPLSLYVPGWYVRGY